MSATQQHCNKPAGYITSVKQDSNVIIEAFIC